MATTVGVVATGISGFWVQLVQGLVMGGSIILNTLIVEGRFAVLTERVQRWGLPIGSGYAPEGQLPPQSGD